MKYLILFILIPFISLSQTEAVLDTVFYLDSIFPGQGIHYQKNINIVYDDGRQIVRTFKWQDSITHYGSVFQEAEQVASDLSTHHSAVAIDKEAFDVFNFLTDRIDSISTLSYYDSQEIVHINFFQNGNWILQSDTSTTMYFKIQNNDLFTQRISLTNETEVVDGEKFRIHISNQNFFKTRTNYFSGKQTTFVYKKRFRDGQDRLRIVYAQIHDGPLKLIRVKI